MTSRSHSLHDQGVSTDPSCERRTASRHKLVLRIGIVEISGRASFCILRNISPRGVQVKLYGKPLVGSRVRLRVGEDTQIQGKVVWINDQLAGIEFDHELPPATLLRVEHKQEVRRRRGTPRVLTRADAKLRTCGRAYRVILSDISTAGAKFQTDKRLPSSGPATLELPDLPPVSAFIRWSDDEELGVSFGVPMPIEVIAQWLDQRSHVSIG